MIMKVDVDDTGYEDNNGIDNCDINDYGNMRMIVIMMAMLMITVIIMMKL